ncbi:hypothetical protein K450DRAFT_263282 [Umbelopsis ramanniana AG]|uniref:DNA polymerase eta n=1 Tax=Umbelopsis ramanniana AG TaxID=1314678 RepID=A0AAD5DZM7_UMBRA|nr:uncharacterized protein K450DRAFT_263282 [Umbelopsis ramanniana AG]KAI8575106.1 hypothetical protein K450DRAFT_263282 [Umbelopsis ramanniana AG]
MSKQRLPLALKGSQCILHIDLDCFYCQVEQVRLNLPPDLPVAVQQWQGLIAVNYPAKAAGITRHMPIEEAFKKCPNLRPVHVATFNMHDPIAKYNDNPSQLTHKVSLDIYRKASQNIFKIFQKYCSKVQKAGLDEAFLDVTDIVNARLIEKYGSLFSEDATEEFSNEIDWEPLGFLALSDEESSLLNPTSVEGDDAVSHLIASDRSPPAPKLKGNWKDLQLSIGAEIAKEIRKDIFDTLKYTCSAGIAHNKTVAKLCSALNKPNKQTTMRETIVLKFMKSIPFTKIRNLGGKLGNEVENALNIQTAGDLWKYSSEELQAKFGQSQGIWLYDICRGIDNSEVTTIKITKSMMASKVFSPPLRLISDVERWMAVLGSEIYMRMMDDFEERSRWPKTLVIHFRCSGEGSGRSKSCPMVKRSEVISPDVITQRANELFKTCEHPFPLLHMSLAVSGLTVDESSSTHNITKFFSNSAEGNFNHKLAFQETTTVDMKASSSRSAKYEKVESNKKGIAALFFSRKDTSSTDAEEGTRCDECGNWIAIKDVAEHADYHFAKKLQDEDRHNQNTAAQSNSVPTSKKRKGVPSNNDTQKESRRLFFQPRRS